MPICQVLYPPTAYTSFSAELLTNIFPTGAAVLAHSLRDAGSKKKLVCLIVPGGLQDSTIQELRVRSYFCCVQH